MSLVIIGFCPTYRIISSGPFRSDTPSAIFTPASLLGAQPKQLYPSIPFQGLIIRKKQGLGKPALITLNYPADAKLIAKEAEDVQA